MEREDEKVPLKQTTRAQAKKKTKNKNGSKVDHDQGFVSYKTRRRVIVEIFSVSSDGSKR